MVLYQHDRDFYIDIHGQDLMNSRQHESELQLAELGCAHLKSRQECEVLIGGLGMGYTLRRALDMLSPHAKVLVAELMGELIEWNRDFLGVLNDHPLKDERVDIQNADVVKIISRSENRFDAILLDVDNGPSAMTDPGNSRLYSPHGIVSCRRALRKNGSLAVWSANSSKKFEQALKDCDFHVRRYRVPAYKGSKSRSRIVWVASEDQRNLPEGGR